MLFSVLAWLMKKCETTQVSDIKGQEYYGKIYNDSRKGYEKE